MDSVTGFRRCRHAGAAAGLAGVTLLWGLVAFGQIRLRRINGYRDLPELLEQQESCVAVG